MVRYSSSPGDRGSVISSTPTHPEAIAGLVLGQTGADETHIPTYVAPVGSQLARSTSYPYDHSVMPYRSLVTGDMASSNAVAVAAAVVEPSVQQSVKHSEHVRRYRHELAQSSTLRQTTSSKLTWSRRLQVSRRVYVAVVWNCA